MDFKLGILLLAAGWVGGCAGLSGESSGARDGGTADGAAGGTALATRNIEHSRSDGLLAVQFDLINRSSKTIEFKWTIDWSDRSGAKLDYGSPVWTSERLASGASKSVRVVAPLASAESWSLRTDLPDGAQ